MSITLVPSTYFQNTLLLVQKPNNIHNTDKSNNIRIKKAKELVSKGRYSLQYLPEDLRDNKEIVLAAVAQNSGAIEYASYALQHDKDVRRAAGRQK